MKTAAKSKVSTTAVAVSLGIAAALTGAAVFSGTLLEWGVPHQLIDAVLVANNVIIASLPFVLAATVVMLVGRTVFRSASDDLRQRRQAEAEWLRDHGEVPDAMMLAVEKTQSGRYVARLENVIG